MKKSILIIITFLVCFASEAQNNNQLDRMINESLLSFIEKRIEWQNKGFISKDYFDNLYISIDNYPRSFAFSEKLQNMNLKYMSLINLSGQKELKKKRGYNFLFMGINLKGDVICITISDKTVSIQKRNNLHIAISDWGEYTYKYFCEKHEWILIDTKYNGV